MIKKKKEIVRSKAVSRQEEEIVRSKAFSRQEEAVKKTTKHYEFKSSWWLQLAPLSWHLGHGDVVELCVACWKILLGLERI